jgi:hypothetical protein
MSGNQSAVSSCTAGTIGTAIRTGHVKEFVEIDDMVEIPFAVITIIDKPSQLQDRCPRQLGEFSRFDSMLLFPADCASGLTHLLRLGHLFNGCCQLMSSSDGHLDACLVCRCV